MSSLYGSWAITWSDSDHTGVDRQHLLRVPLQRIRPGVSVNQHTATSLDYTTQNTVVFGSAYEIGAKIKAEDNSQSLADLIEAGMKGTTLTLVDLAQTDRTVDVYMIDPADAWLATYDMQGTPWEYETDVRFRRTAGTAFPDWLLYQAYGPNGLLFKYTAGQDLSAATFTRAASANYINVSGVTTAAATNVARDAHYQTVSSTWTRTLRCEASTSEALYWPWVHKPQAQTVYCRFVERGTILSGTNAVLFHIGTTTAAWFAVLESGGVYRVFHDNGATLLNAAAGTAPSNGDEVEIVAQLAADGTATIIQTIVGGATSTASTAANTLASTWTLERLIVANDNNGTKDGSADYVDIRVAAGVQTLDHMRGL